MSGHVYTVSDECFEMEVLKVSFPVLVDFWAEWCQPCKMINSVVKEIAKEYVGRLKVFKLNVDENTKTPIKYGIRGIPTILVFREGVVVNRKVGVLSRLQLADFLDESLNFS